MGGGLEWMTTECVFLAEDDLIHKAIKADDLNEAYQKAKFFNKERYWRLTYEYRKRAYKKLELLIDKKYTLNFAKNIYRKADFN